MKKWILSCCMLLSAELTAFAQSSPSVIFDPGSSQFRATIQPEGGMLVGRLILEERNDFGMIVMLGDVRDIQVRNYNSAHIDSVKYSGSACYFYFSRNLGKSSRTGSVSVQVIHGSQPYTSYPKFHYLQTYWYRLNPGVIRAPEKIYKVGVLPDKIESVYPAGGGQGGAVVYGWQKRGTLDPEWRDIEGGGYGLSYQSGAVADETEFFRRRACDGVDTVYTDSVAISPQFDAGVIRLATDSLNWVLLSHIERPKVPDELIHWQSSRDLTNWAEQADPVFPLPKAGCHYRCVLRINEGRELFSNTVTYDPDRRDIYVATHRAQDGQGAETAESRTYFDGLGRKHRQVDKHVLDPGIDRVTPHEYDLMGRQEKEFLPYPVSTTGIPAADPYAGDIPYTRHEYEPSPLGRIVRSFKPGKEYQGDDPHPVEIGYGTNTPQEVRKFAPRPSGALHSDGTYYPAGSLHKTTTTDEDGRRTREFRNTRGNIVLRRRLLPDDTPADTYHIYDDFDRLVCIVPPEASAQADTQGAIPEETAQKYCFFYEYDGAGNLVSRKIPGQGAERLYYDLSDRLTARQTAAMRELNLCQYYRYDPQGRLSELYLQRLAAGETPGAATPETSPKDFMPTNSYRYDSYDDASVLPFRPAPGVAEPADLSLSVRGLKTQERNFVSFGAEVFAAAETPKSASRTLYYDARARMIQSVETTPDGDTVRTSFRYDYAGRPTVRLEEHALADGGGGAYRYEYTYDRWGNRTAERVAVDSVPKTSQSYAYDIQGRTIRTVADSARLQTRYKYTIQGWIKEITSDKKPRRAPFTPAAASADQEIRLDSLIIVPMAEPVFSLRMHYSDPGGNAAPAYNGNISKIFWLTKNDLRTSRSYSYRYDALNRLYDAECVMPSDGTGSYGLRDIRYDLNGNILHMQYRNGTESFGVSRRFDGNRLASTSSVAYAIPIGRMSVTRYSYDVMGNRKTEETIGMTPWTYDYDLLNLPKKITSPELESVNFSYLWNGAKYEVRTSAGDGLRYVGSARYRILDGQAFFESIPFSQGRIVATSEGTQAEYHLKDHLGSVRVVTDEDAKIKARYDYLPYGEQHIDPEFPTSDDNDFRFTGKEWLGRFTGLALYDSKARLQDIDGRFLSPDPKADSDPGTSPYAYCAGNPVMKIDPDGEKWVNADGWSKYLNGRPTKYADAYDKQLANELQKTPTGKQMFEYLINGPVYTQIKLDKLDVQTYGKTDNKFHGSELYSAVITLDIRNLQDKAVDLGISHWQAIASTLGHEIRHTQDENVQMQLQTSLNGDASDYKNMPEEIDARGIGEQIIHEYRNNIKPQSDEKSIFRSLWDRIIRMFD